MTIEEDKGLERRKARAQREANQAQDWLTQPLKVRAGRRKAWAKRELALKPMRKKVEFQRGRQRGRAVKTVATAEKLNSIITALRAYWSDHPRAEKYSAERLADQLRPFASSYFPSGLPYESPSKFLREVRIALRQIRPKHKAHL
jgi:hypothetical protein